MRVRVVRARAAGLKRSRAGLALIGGAAFALVGCVGTSGASVQQLRARATFDLQCPGPQTEVIELDERTRGVRGCGKQMTYVEVCDNRPDGWHCTWVLNAPAWFVAPQRVPPKPEGTWWWTEPNGIAKQPSPPALPPARPDPTAPIEPEAPPPLAAPLRPIVLPPVLPPMIAAPPATPLTPLPLVPLPLLRK